MVELSIGSCESRAMAAASGGFFQHPSHVGRTLRCFDLRHALIVGARHFIQLEGKLIVFQPGEPVGEVVDGIVRSGQRAVAPGIGHRELKIGIQLFGSVYTHHHRLAVIAQNAPAVVVENELSVHKIPMVLQKPVDAVRRAAFLVGGERENNVTVGYIPLFLEADQSNRHDGIPALHILRAAAIVEAVFFDELEWIGCPIFAMRLDNIEMTDQQDGFLRAAPVEAYDQIFLAIIGTENVKVALDKSRIAETLSHGLGGDGYAAYGVGGIDLNQLLEDVVRELFCGIVNLRLRRPSENQEKQKKEEK